MLRPIRKQHSKSFVKSYEKRDFPNNHQILLSNPVKQKVLGCSLFVYLFDIKTKQEKCNSYKTNKNQKESPTFCSLSWVSNRAISSRYRWACCCMDLISPVFCSNSPLECLSSRSSFSLRRVSLWASLLRTWISCESCKQTMNGTYHMNNEHLRSKHYMITKKSISEKIWRHILPNQLKELCRC